MKAMSVRAYSRHRTELGLQGCSEGAVRYAIRSGRVSKAVTKAGKIRSAELADAEWLAGTKTEMAPLTGPTAPGAHLKGRGRTLTGGVTREASSELPEASSEASEPPTNDLAAARARRESATASMAEIELARTRGELVEARHVEARVGDVILRCRTRLLGLPVRARQSDPTLTERQIKLLETLLYEALDELAGSATT